MRGLSTSALLLAPVLVGAASPEGVVSTNIKLKRAQDVDLTLQLEVFQTHDACSYPNVAIQGVPLNNDGLGALSLSGDTPAVGHWKATCDGEEQILVVTLDSVKEQPLENLEFTVRFRQIPPIQILGLSGPDVEFPTLDPFSDLVGSPEDDVDEIGTLRVDLEEDREDLEHLRFMITRLEQEIRVKEIMLKTLENLAEPSEEESDECKGFLCFLKGVFDRITGLAHPGRGRGCGNHTHGNHSRGNHSWPHPPWWRHRHGNHTHGNHTHGNHTFPHPPWRRPHHRIPFFCRPHHRPHHPPHHKPHHPPGDDKPDHGFPHGGPPPWVRPGGGPPPWGSGPPPWARPGGGPPPWGNGPPPWARPGGGSPPWGNGPPPWARIGSGPYRGGPMHGPHGHAPSGQPAFKVQVIEHHRHGPPVFVKIAILSVLFTGLFAAMRRRCRARRARREAGLRNACCASSRGSRCAFRAPRHLMNFVARLRGRESAPYEYMRDEEEGLIEKSHALMEEGVIDVVPGEKGLMSEKEVEAEEEEDHMTMSQELKSFREAAHLVEEMVVAEEKKMEQ